MTASTSSSSSSSSSSSVSPTKIQSSTKGTKQVKQRRNERERKRVDQVNQGFLLLKERVPRTPGSKAKLSKVETLREAARYIRQLQRQLECVNSSMPMDFPTPDNSPIYPQSICSMPPQTPSPSYMSPYYPPPQKSQYYSETAAITSSDDFYSNGESY